VAEVAEVAGLGGSMASVGGIAALSGCRKLSAATCAAAMCSPLWWSSR